MTINKIQGKKQEEAIPKAKEEYGVTIPWYVMTSKDNHDETVCFLENNNYFGYEKDKVKFFKQGELPLIDTQGRVILDENVRIKEAADGNGGIYEAFAKSGLLDELKQKQTDWIFVSGIDNILSNFVDPILLGLTIKENNVIASKSVAKAYPQEKAGVFCKMNGKSKIIEYIDLPKEMSEELDENGELKVMPDFHSVFDAARFALSQYVSIPTDYPIAYADRVGVATCECCGRLFIKNGNRQKYCGCPECKKERNRRKSRTAYRRKIQEENANRWA